MLAELRCILKAGDLIMRLRQSIPALFHVKRPEKTKRNNTEIAIAIPLARCARVPRATAQPAASLILRRGLSGPRSDPPVSRALPCDNPATLARGGRALIRWAADAVTWAGGGCAVTPSRANLAATGAGLTRWAGQASNAVGGVPGADWTPAGLPRRTGPA